MRAIANIRVPDYVPDHLIDQYVNDKIANFPAGWGAEYGSCSKIVGLNIQNERHYILQYQPQRPLKLPDTLKDELARHERDGNKDKSGDKAPGGQPSSAGSIKEKDSKPTKSGLSARVS